MKNIYFWWWKFHGRARKMTNHCVPMLKYTWKIYALIHFIYHETQYHQWCKTPVVEHIFLCFTERFRRISFIDISTVRFCNLRFYISVLTYNKTIQCGKCQQIFMVFISKSNMVTLFKAFVYHFVLICPKDRRRAIHWKNYCWIIKVEQHCAGI